MKEYQIKKHGQYFLRTVIAKNEEKKSEKKKKKPKRTEIFPKDYQC